mmetsp:Transcript_36343/g.120331  ORF Transcript_36343/g.120331 Transcript_36343/m.120331 type:complete len:213 (+) Transcript_36343:348-986(+)
MSAYSPPRERSSLPHARWPACGTSCSSSSVCRWTCRCVRLRAPPSACCAAIIAQSSSSPRPIISSSSSASSSDDDDDAPLSPPPLSPSALPTAPPPPPPSPAELLQGGVLLEASVEQARGCAAVAGELQTGTPPLRGAPPPKRWRGCARQMERSSAASGRAPYHSPNSYSPSSCAGPQAELPSTSLKSSGEAARALTSRLAEASQALETREA